METRLILRHVSDLWCILALSKSLSVAAAMRLFQPSAVSLSILPPLNASIVITNDSMLIESVGVLDLLVGTTV